VEAVVVELFWQTSRIAGAKVADGFRQAVSGLCLR
jgi:hypothetical protein